MTNVEDVPSFKSLDSKMQKGYNLFDAGDEAGACRVWLEVWSDVLSIFDNTGIQSIKEFDEHFQGTQYLCNWVSDMEMALWNAGLDNPEFLTSRIAFCDELLRRFGGDGENLRNENARRAIAECYSHLGQVDKVDALYNEWLTNDPRWGWGWIGWSDCYFFATDGSKDLAKSEGLLRKGLSTPDVRDRDDILDRLADLPETLKRNDEAAEVRKQIKPKSLFAGLGDSSPSGDRAFEDILRAACNTPVTRAPSMTIRTDRRKPCPCGSGKRFKNCCGRGLR